MKEMSLILNKTTNLLSEVVQLAPRGEVEQKIVHVQQILQEMMHQCLKCRKENASHYSCPNDCETLRERVIDAFGLDKE